MTGYGTGRLGTTRYGGGSLTTTPRINASGSGDGSSDASALGFIVTGAGLLLADGSSDAGIFPTPQVVVSGVIDNRAGGRNRVGLGAATWDPPVVPPPPTTVVSTEMVAAQVYTAPVINGVRVATAATIKRIPQQLDRILMGGHDVTYFRDVATPFPGYQLQSPLMFGPTTIVFPQINAAFEILGVGDLKWCRPNASVELQRVNEDGSVVSDYRGVVVGFGISGNSLSVDVGGEAQGRAAMVDRQNPIWTSYQDIGRYAYSAMKDINFHLQPYLGPTTGIRFERFGGESLLDYINDICSKAYTRDGNQWTIMPATNNYRGFYEMRRKDTTTIAASAYLDDTRTVGDLKRDVSEEPNRIFVTGITPEGEIIRNGVYPGLKQGPAAPYPFTDHTHDFGIGTTDADTDTGDGISVMIARLVTTKYMDQNQLPGGFDSDVGAAIEDLQQDMGRAFISPVMDFATWEALWDLAVTGFSLRWSHIEPMAQQNKVRKWNRSASGAIIGRNLNYDPNALTVDRTIDMGSGITKQQMHRWSDAVLDRSATPNWVGPISFPMGALVSGTHNPGDGFDESRVYPARNLRTGMNIWLPLFQGGIQVHVSTVRVGTDGTVQADVDTRARDSMEVWQIIQRKRASRKSPARDYLNPARSSTIKKDSIGTWDEIGGMLGVTIDVPANKWVVFPVVSGQEGTVRSLRIETNPNAEYVLAVTGQPIYPERLQALIGNPLTKAGTKKWTNQSIRDAIDKKNTLLYVVGDNDNPCGYYPKQKTGTGDQTNTDPSNPTFAPAAPLTGEWFDDAGFSYHTAENPVLYVAVYADRHTSIPRGQLMWDQLEAGV